MMRTVQQRYPVRYWLTLAYVTGIPNFIHFDPTGLTHKNGLFNSSSLSDIGFTALMVVMFVIVTALSREGLFVRKFKFNGWIWLALLIGLTLSTLLQPDPRFYPPKATDALVSLFRLGQCALGFLLIVSLYSRAEEEEAPGMLTQFIVRMCWANLVTAWVMAPIVPSLAYTSEDGTAGGIARLGGIAINPSMIALEAAVVFLHSFLMLRGSRRVIGCLLSLLSLGLTYTRSTQIVCLFVFCLYLIFLSPRRSVRWLGVGSVLLAICTGFVFQSKVESYILRGQREADAATADGRTAIWEVAVQAWAEHPILGYGYISGPRNAIRDNWREAHWLPPHAHNEFLQALLSGGIVSGGLIIWLYAYITWKGFRRARDNEQTMFFFLVWLILVFISVVSTNITTGFGKPGVFFLGCFLILVAEAHKSPATRPASVPLPKSLSTDWKLAEVEV
jgi:O-antigen ligase